MTTYSHEQRVLRVRPGNRFLSCIILSQVESRRWHACVEWSSGVKHHSKRCLASRQLVSGNEGGDCARLLLPGSLSTEAREQAIH